MSKENKQLENRKAFYDDFAVKFSETKLKEVIQKKREEAGFMNCAKRLSKQFPPLLKMTKKKTYGLCKVNSWTNIVAVAAGGYYTIDLRADGTVVAVGVNDLSQCAVSDWKLW